MGSDGPVIMDRDEVVKRIDEARVARQQMTADLAAIKEKLTLISEAMPMFLDILTRLDQRMHRIEHMPPPITMPHIPPSGVTPWAPPAMEYHMLTKMEMEYGTGHGGVLTVGGLYRGKLIKSVDFDPYHNGWRIGVQV